MLLTRARRTVVVFAGRMPLALLLCWEWTSATFSGGAVVSCQGQLPPQPVRVGAPPLNFQEPGLPLANMWPAALARSYGNPTTRACEEKIRELEGAEDCLVSSSGMNSATTVGAGRWALLEAARRVAPQRAAVWEQSCKQAGRQAAQQPHGTGADVAPASQGAERRCWAWQTRAAAWLSHRNHDSCACKQGKQGRHQSCRVEITLHASSACTVPQPLRAWLMCICRSLRGPHRCRCCWRWCLLAGTL